MKRVIFASDFHLKFHEQENDKKRREKILQFIDELIGNTELLVLNGDIFDLWFAWNEVIIRGYFSFLCKLSQLRNSGCKIVFIAGNHDFWFNGFLEKELAIEVYSDNYSCEIQGKKILFNHGDLYTANDLRYKVFRSAIRNPFIMSFFKILHPDLSLKIGMLLSRSSRDRKVPKALQKAKERGLENFANQMMGKYDFVILGHSHNPKIVEFDDGTYGNCGDWIKNRSYLELIDGKLVLRRFDS